MKFVTRDQAARSIDSMKRYSVFGARSNRNMNSPVPAFNDGLKTVPRTSGRRSAGALISKVSALGPRITTESITMGTIGLSPVPVGKFVVSRKAATMDVPAVTFPNTECFRSRNEDGPRVMKNWEPAVFGGAVFAMEMTKSGEWRSERSNSSRIA